MALTRDDMNRLGELGLKHDPELCIWSGDGYWIKDSDLKTLDPYEIDQVLATIRDGEAVVRLGQLELRLK
jgi:hypothetical protein